MKVGLDVGSTTIKCVVLDDADQIIYSTYERHFSHILEKSEELCEKLDYLTSDGRGKIYYSAYRDVMNLNRRDA